MRERSISAIGVVLVGLVPALLGDFIFAAVFIGITVVAFREASTLLGISRQEHVSLGIVAIIISALLAWYYPDGRYLPMALAICVLLPLAWTIFQDGAVTDRRDWASLAGATLYLALPTFAALSIRGMEGTADHGWFNSFADAVSIVNGTAIGLGWFLTALLVTWLSDTAAYLVGKSVGRTKLIPRVSPNKTVEGAIGGLVAAGVTAALCIVGFGLGVHPLTAVLFGIVIGVIGMIGDLGESIIKRRAGVKDSGNLIPGHGGMLDRIDALIFVLVFTWALLPALV